MTIAEFQKLVAASSGRVAIDVGTGDGLFPYNCARNCSDKLYIGIDSNIRPLEKISEKIYRNPLKDGAPNVLYLQASAEALPEELNEIAQEAFVLYPWGSLLRGVLAPEADVIRSLRRICRQDALLRIVVAIDPARDQTEIERLELDLENDLKTRLICRYSEEGFVFVSDQSIELRTTWSKRLGQNQNRAAIHLCFRAR